MPAATAAVEPAAAEATMVEAAAEVVTMTERRFSLAHSRPWVVVSTN